MDTLLQISGFLRQHRWVVLAIGIVLGLLVGLAIGWWWFPVEWSNATPGQLRWDFRDDYVVWVAQQYESSGDVDWARSKLGVEYWGGKDEVAQIMDEVATKRSGDDAVRINALKQVLVAQEGGGSDEATAGGRSLLANAWPICLVFLVVVFVAGGGLYLYSRWRGKQLEDEAKGRRPPAERARPVEQVSWGAEGPPLAQFPTTYTLGDDHYDPSFSVELETGEFMGECGVGISETIGVGAPNKVTAFEVWLFDKSDIRTVTKVLMSDYAFHDEALRTKLAPKGEPMLADQGKEVVLETKTLRVRARVVEAVYGVGNLPANSHFERLSIDLVVWVKPGHENAEPAGVDRTEMPLSLG